MKKYSVFIAYTAALVLVITLVSSGITFLITRANNIKHGDLVTITKEQYSRLLGYKRLTELEQYIDQIFLDDVERQTLLDGAAKGVVASLGDPYSRYYTPEETEQISQSEKGEYAGIGVLFSTDPRDGLLTAMRVYSNSPAEKVGLMAGDKVYQVNGEDMTGKEQGYVVDLLRGEENTSVEVTLLRENELISVNMTREIVTVNRVDSRMLSDGIGLITIDEFEGDVVKGFKSALEALKKEKAQGIIIDLRGNPGGNLDMVVEACDMILPKGTVVSMSDKQGETRTFTSGASMISSLPLVVLVDGHSASASEIMAAAVQDFERGIVVGTQTFGKGIVQSYYVFKEDNASLALTSAEYFTPNGRSIHGLGVTPDILSELPQEIIDNPSLLNDENDTQLSDAVEALHELIAQKEAA